MHFSSNPPLPIAGTLVLCALTIAGCTHTAEDRAAPDRGAATSETGNAEHQGHQGGGGEPAAATGLSRAAGGYRLVTTATRLQSGAAREVAFRIVDSKGAAVRRFAIEQAKRMHLIIVRRDLTGFRHVHPAMASDGTWRVAVEVDRSGPYRAFADFVVGDERRVLGFDLRAPGRYRPVPLAPPSRTASAGGYAVRLVGGDQLRPRSEQRLTFTVEREGTAVRDLQPYLGALGHLVVLRAGNLSYLHAHPEHTGGSGPRIAFVVEAGDVGLHRAFMQFRVARRVRTAAFTLAVGG